MRHFCKRFISVWLQEMQFDWLAWCTSLTAVLEGVRFLERRLAGWVTRCSICSQLCEFCSLCITSSVPAGRGNSSQGSTFIGVCAIPTARFANGLLSWPPANCVVRKGWFEMLHFKWLRKPSLNTDRLKIVAVGFVVLLQKAVEALLEKITYY